MEVKIKKLREDAQIPKYADNGCAGMDIVATSMDITDDYIEYGTGLAFEVPPGYVMLIFPRSSNSNKDLILSNSVGVLDSSYRGELRFRFKRHYRCYEMNDDFFSFERRITDRIGWHHADESEWIATRIYEVGDRIGQIIILPYPQISFKEVAELSETERGTGGFGSTGK